MYICRYIYVFRALLLISNSARIFNYMYIIPYQVKHMLALHMACARTSGIVATVQILLRYSGKDSRLAPDKVKAYV